MSVSENVANKRPTPPLKTASMYGGSLSRSCFARRATISLFIWMVVSVLICINSSAINAFAACISHVFDVLSFT
jgi:hypothetical protein